MIDRWPAVAAIALCLAALVIADQSPREEAVPFSSLAPELMPVASGPDALGSTWYCPGGLVALDGSLDHVIIITNPTANAAVGQLTVYPAVPDGLGASTPVDVFEDSIEVPAGAQFRISLGARIPDEPIYVNAVEVYVAALLEVATPGVIVEHSIVSPAGTDLGSCSSTTAESWHFASGTTKGGARDLVAVLNPFPGTASVDIWFPNDTGTRRPAAYDGLVLPPQSVTMLDVRNHATAQAQMAMTVQTRSGRVVVERLQLFNEEEGPRGATLTLGAPESSTQWFFPGGRSAPGQAESYVIYNPNEDPAEVEVEVQFDDPKEDAVPVKLAIAGNSRVIVLLDDSDTHPVSEAPGGILRLTDQMADTSGQYWVGIRSFNEVGVVAERLTSMVDSSARGMTAVMGAPLAGTSAFLALPVNEVATTEPQLVLLNPSPDTIAQISVSALVGGTRVDLFDVELGARRRAVAVLDDLPTGAVALAVESSQPVMAELSVQGESGAIAALAVPVIDGARVPEFFAGS